jgi:hypothetical protein
LFVIRIYVFSVPFPIPPEARIHTMGGLSMTTMYADFCELLKRRQQPKPKAERMTLVLPAGDRQFVEAEAQRVGVSGCEYIRSLIQFAREGVAHEQG